ncbi:MAG: C45 family autoproteolytic acyltransferase/hydrolase [Candidatus Endonucleobacter sp. (ex Gigantidas childressi)]|nr:C45 family autoproteolytic acyltransferase/hydrolase [Candidatus Endonucleobacter sp. (ex Gigantidas childressi)]
MIKLRSYHFNGTPEQIGHAHGEELKESILSFIQTRLDAAVKYFLDQGIKDDSLISNLRNAGRECYNIFANWDPEGFIEHNAIARAAGVDAADLYTVSNYTDIRDAYMLTGSQPDSEGCSAVMIPATHTLDNTILAGQTWDLNPEDIDYVVAIHTKPKKGPARWSIQLAGSLSLMGMNSKGLAIGTTNLKTWGSKLGVGYINIIHRAMRCNTIEEAAQVIDQAPKSGAHSYFLSTASKAMHFEVTGFSHNNQVLSSTPMGWTNHCLYPEHKVREYDKPSSSSMARFQRLKTLLQAEPFTVDSIKTIFANHEDAADSINRYPEDKSYAATNACMIADPDKLVLHACRGPADRGEWLALTFND